MNKRDAALEAKPSRIDDGIIEKIKPKGIK